MKKKNKFTNYYSKIGDGFVCTLCGNKMSTQGNIIKHVKNVHDVVLTPDASVKESQYTYTTKSGKQKPVMKPTLKAIEWKVMHGVSMEAICDPIFKYDVFQHPELIKSYDTMSRIVHCIAEQILENNIALLQNEKVALVGDGGTVQKIKWYAIGSTKVVNKNESTSTVLFDLIISEGDSTEEIKAMFEKIKSRLESKGSVVVSVCTDNAYNIANGFINTHELKQVPKTQTQSRPLRLLRVSCAIHTFNLIINDVAKNDSEFKRLINDIKFIPLRLKNVGEQKRAEMGLAGCPNYQPQRWNHLYFLYSYANSHLEAINENFPDIKISKDDCDFMLKILAPLRLAVTCLEANDRNQAHVYLQYIELHKAWEELGNDERFKKISQALIKSLDDKCKYTLDIGISRVVYYSTDVGMEKWREEFRYRNINKDSPPEFRTINRKREEQIEKIKTTITNLCEIWNINNVAEQFIEILDKAKYEEGFKTLVIKSKMKEWLMLHPEDVDGAEDIDNFYQYLRVLPATEAHCERTFARMRDLINEHMSNLGAETIRDEIIIKMKLTEGDVYKEKSKYITPYAMSTAISSERTSSSESEDY